MSQEPGVEDPLLPKLHQSINVQSGPLACANLIDHPFSLKGGRVRPGHCATWNWDKFAVKGPVEQCLFQGWGKESLLSILGSGYPRPLSSLPPCVVLLCAFDHLLGLKKLYAKRSRTGVMTPWLQGPCPLLAHHPLQFRLGGQTGVAAVLSPRGHTTLSDCLRAHLPLRGDGPPQCLLAEAPAQELCLWACEPLPYVLHACIFCSQSVAIPPRPDHLPLAGGGLGGETYLGPPELFSLVDF